MSPTRTTPAHSTRGGTPPYPAPYFAAEAGMDSLAVSYAADQSWKRTFTVIFAWDA
jgi:hypothetical protein